MSGQKSTADRVAYAFYACAALTALVGQVWAAVDHIPWGDDVPDMWVRVLLVTPAVAVMELGGVATAGLADVRRRIGERAIAYRTMSALAALAAVAFNAVGHADRPYLAIGFSGLSAFAFALWLAHSGARRRDALRAAGQLDQTTPVYGASQWLKEPSITRLARALALRHSLGVQESLTRAREEIRTDTRRAAIAATVEQFIRAEHKNPLHAKIACSTYDMDALADEIAASADYPGWARAISRTLSPPLTDSVNGDRSVTEVTGVSDRTVSDGVGQSFTGDRSLAEVTGVSDRTVSDGVGQSVTGDRSLAEVTGVSDRTVSDGVGQSVTGDRSLAEVTGVSEEQQRQAARERYEASVQAGEPLTGAALARKFGRSPRWGARRAAEARQGAALALVA